MLSRVALLALAAAIVEATPQGFNYGATKSDGSAFQQSEFESMFKQAQNLPGTSGFTSARLYTMLQPNTDQVSSAIPAAISTKTHLLLGMWVSGGSGSDAFNAELAGLNKAISQYGDQLKGLIDGISVGSEDIYRDSPLGKSSANPGPGVNAGQIGEWIDQTKQAISSGPLAGVPVGHVDTWTAWTGAENISYAIGQADFLGVDAYPYWQNTDSNAIESGKSLFNEAMQKTEAVAQGKPLWITETGWPVKGKSSNLATASTDNAQKFWQQVGCSNFGSTPTWWYTMMEQPTGDNPDFSIFDTGAGKPYFDLSCANVQNSTGTDDGSATGTATGSSSTGTGSSTGSGSGSGSGNGTYTSGSPSNPTASAGSGSGSSTGSGSGSSGSGSGSSGSSGSATTSSASTPVATAGATTLSVFSAGSLCAVAAAVAALL